MKPPAFEYEAPARLDEALGLLDLHGEEGKVLAGGQSLVPLLNFRLARPQTLIDVNRLEELSYLRRERGILRIGALTRHISVERSPLVSRHWPLITEAMRWVGHPQIRNRGTAGGSVAHADPAAELPVVLTALGARFHVRSLRRGPRALSCWEMFRGQLVSGLELDELLTEIEVPPMAPASGWAFLEFARRHGDFALGGAAVVVELADNGACERAAIAMLGAAPTPIRAAQAEEALLGRAIDGQAAEDAAAQAVREIRPTGDIHGGSDYRRDLIGVLVRRALLTARGRASREAI
jgi:carbon-monoxide dehydrogenase medium subunit/6-hydroxypseudooxynicotine dehydrogenase subunit alpha